MKRSRRGRIVNKRMIVSNVHTRENLRQAVEGNNDLLDIYGSVSENMKILNENQALLLNEIRDTNNRIEKKISLQLFGQSALSLLICVLIMAIMFF